MNLGWISSGDIQPKYYSFLEQRLHSIELLKPYFMCMVALFGGYANKMPQDAMTFISSQAATFFGIPFNESYISSMLARNSDSDMMIETVVSIKSRKAKEFLLLTCHDFAANSSSDEASFLLGNIAADMGYDKFQFHQLVKTYK